MSVQSTPQTDALNEPDAVPWLVAAPGGWVPEMIDAVEAHFRFRDREDVRGFLAARPDLLAVLVDGIRKIPQAFPSYLSVELEVFRDREDDGDQGMLFAVVRTNQSPEKVRRQMDRLEEDWLVHISSRVGDRFNVGVEFA